MVDDKHTKNKKYIPPCDCLFTTFKDRSVVIMYNNLLNYYFPYLNIYNHILIPCKYF